MSASTSTGSSSFAARSSLSTRANGSGSSAAERVPDPAPEPGTWNANTSAPHAASATPSDRSPPPRDRSKVPSLALVATATRGRRRGGRLARPRRPLALADFAPAPSAPRTTSPRPRQDTNAGAPTFHDTSGCVATNAANAPPSRARHARRRQVRAREPRRPAAHSDDRPDAERRRRRAPTAAPPPPRRRPPPELRRGGARGARGERPHRAAAAPAPARRRTAPEPNAWNAPARDRDALRSAVSSARKRSRFVKTFGGLTRAPGETSGDGERDPERSDDRERDRSGDRSRARERDRADAGGGPSERFFSRGGDAAALFVAAFSRSFPGQSLGENVTSGARFFFSFAAGIVSGTSFPRGGSSAPSRTAERGGLGVDGFGSGSSGGSDEATPRAAPFATPSTSATDPSRPFQRRPRSTRSWVSTPACFVSSGTTPRRSTHATAGLRACASPGGRGRSGLGGAAGCGGLRGGVRGGARAGGGARRGRGGGRRVHLVALRRDLAHERRRGAARAGRGRVVVVVYPVQAVPSLAAETGRGERDGGGPRGAAPRALGVRARGGSSASSRSAMRRSRARGDRGSAGVVIADARRVRWCRKIRRRGSDARAERAEAFARGRRARRSRLAAGSRSRARGSRRGPRRARRRRRAARACARWGNAPFRRWSSR